MSTDDKEVTLRLVRRVLEPDKSADPVHHFLFVQVGNNVLLEAGYLDFAELKTAIDQGRETGGIAEATLFIKHRLQLTPQALQQLVDASQEILAALNATTKHEVTQ